jgi:mediator of RNA polymerase II transcription subunit 25
LEHIEKLISEQENGQFEVKPDNWPGKLIMQLIPKTLVQTIGGQYFRNSKSVLFHPTECESLDALTKVMMTGFAGCVHFTGKANSWYFLIIFTGGHRY